MNTKNHELEKMKVLRDEFADMARDRLEREGKYCHFRYPALERKYSTMPSLRIIKQTAAQWGLQPAVPGVLHAPRTERAPAEGSGSGHASRHRAPARGTQKGGRCSIRRPSPGETPLSWDERIILAAELGRI
jgi:hypothetical protein